MDNKFPGYAASAASYVSQFQQRLEQRSWVQSANAMQQVASLLTRSRKYYFPDAKEFVDHINRHAPHAPELRKLPDFPLCIEAPWHSPIDLLSRSGHVLERSTRRIALVFGAEHAVEVLAAGGIPAEGHFDDGIFVISLFWGDETKEWNISPGAAFIPLSDWNESARTARKPGEELTFPVQPVPLFPEIFSNWVKKRVSVKSVMQDMMAEIHDETLLAAFCVQMLLKHDEAGTEKFTPGHIVHGEEPKQNYVMLSRPSVDFWISEDPQNLETCDLKAVTPQMPYSHIERLGFSSLRKLHLNRGFKLTSALAIDAWRDSLRNLPFARINLIVGQNGAGKSTVVDLLDSLRYPAKLATLQRENTKSDAVAGFEITFNNGAMALGLFSQSTEDETSWSIDRQNLGLIVADSRGTRRRTSVDLNKFEPNDAAVEELRLHFSRIGCNVAYFEDLAPTGTQLDVMAEELCLIGPHLPGLASSSRRPSTDFPHIDQTLFEYQKKHPISGSEQGYLNLWLADDRSQTNRVSLTALPTGWRVYGSVMAWLLRQPAGTICLLDEPDRHLHPTLQRLFARRVGEIATRNKLQIVISTHSPTLINSRDWGGFTPNLLEANADGVHGLKNVAGLLRDLGVRQSDILQSNGVIWVEGPSDAIYIRSWMRAYCEECNLELPEDGIEFVFLPYGGALLRHFSVGDEKRLFDMLALNRNMVVVMDQDLDYEMDVNGILINRYPGCAKARIENAVEKMKAESNWTWVTSKYTIENYLPVSLLETYFAHNAAGRLVPRTSRAKVDVAIEFSTGKYTLDQCSDSGDLRQKMRRLLESIAEWNKW